MRRIAPLAFELLILSTLSLCSAVATRRWHESDVLHHLVYIGIEDVDQALGCPVASHACFYFFAADVGEPNYACRVRTCRMSCVPAMTEHMKLPLYLAAEPAAQQPGQPAAACHAVRRNCNRHGECIKTRDWCIIRHNLPAWLLARFPGRWPVEDRPAYLCGRTDLLNPTHIASLHFLPLVRWMDQAHIAPGQARRICSL